MGESGKYLLKDIKLRGKTAGGRAQQRNREVKQQVSQLGNNFR